MKKSDNQKEMLFLIGYKSRTGIIMYACILGILLTVIGLFLPFCSYNPSILSETKRNVGYTDLSYLVIISSILLIAAIIMLIFVVASLSRSAWKEKTGRYTVLPILALIFTVISIVLVAFVCIFYEIPESEFEGLETQMEAGFYLFAVGSLLFSLAFLFFSLALKNLANGKTTIEKLTISKRRQEDKKATGGTLSEKLEELQRLKDSGLITEEEFQLKKEELLKFYQ